jgi:hypothetical protein
MLVRGVPNKEGRAMTVRRVGKGGECGGVGDADKAINKNDENIIALALPDPPTQQPNDDDDAEGMVIKKNADNADGKETVGRRGKRG